MKRIRVALFLIVHTMLLGQLNAQQELLLGMNAGEVVEVMLERIDEQTYQADFVLLKDIGEELSLVTNYDDRVFEVTSQVFPNNARKKGVLFFKYKIPVKIKISLPSDQIAEVPIVFTSQINNEEVVVFRGFWRNPVPKGLKIESLNSSIPVDVQENEVKEGQFELNVKYKLINESSEEILLRPVLSGKPGNDIRIATGGELEYIGVVSVTRSSNKTTGQEEVDLRFKNTRFPGAEYAVPVLNIAWKILKPARAIRFPFEWVMTGLLIIILLILIFSKRNRRLKASGVRNQSVVAREPAVQVDDKLNKVLAKTSRNNNHLLERILKVVDDPERSEQLRLFITSAIAANNEVLLKALSQTSSTKAVASASVDSEKEKVLGQLVQMLDVNDYQSAPGALADLVKRLGVTKAGNVLWKQGLTHFESAFAEMDETLTGNSYYISSRMTSDDFSYIEDFDKVIEHLDQDGYLKLITKVLRVSSWKVGEVQFRDEELAAFFREINYRSEQLAYAKRMLLDALGIRKYKLIVPDIFVDMYLDTHIRAPTAPVMQGKWRVLGKELQLSQHSIYDIFSVGIMKEGKIIRKAVVSVIP